ncbi:trigger factor [bacterium]|nr:trigger factor [bacterium]
MSYSIKNQEKVDKNKIKLKVEISNGYFNKSVNSAYKAISEKAKIPGFRKGKVPYQIIDINYGKEYVLSEAANIAISELYSEIIESSDLKPVDYPKVDIDGELNQDKPVNFDIIIEVEPEAILPGYTGIAAEGYPMEVTEEEINAQVENLRNRFASLEPIGEDETSKNLDIATIDFKGTIDGEEFEGGSQTDYVLEIGSGVLLKEIEKALIGMKKGEEKTVSAKMPKEIEDKKIAGKKAEFKLTAKEIKRKSLPEIDAEFLKNMGDFETADDLKKFIKENLEEQKKTARKNKIFSDIVNYLVENSKLDVPKIMIDNEIKELAHDFEHRLQDQNLTKEQYMQYFKITEDKINEDFRKRAEFNVKEYLIFNTLEKELKDKIEPSKDELASEKENLLNTTKKEEDRKKIEEYFKTPAGEKNILGSVRRKKLVDFLIENAKIKELSLEDLKKLALKDSESEEDNKDSLIEDNLDEISADEESIVDEILSEDKE